MDNQQNFWENRWQTNDTPWDTNGITAPLKAYFDQLQNKDIKILIPGCGNGYEGEYLWNNGFKNVFMMDISAEPLEKFNARVPHFPKDNLLVGDFFAHQNQYDLIVEQTFFCALTPNLRPYYVTKIHELLLSNGTLAGLLFDAELNAAHPPYGGNAAEYKSLFAPLFKMKTMQPCYNSIKPRMGKEVFIILKKIA